MKAVALTIAVLTAIGTPRVDAADSGKQNADLARRTLRGYAECLLDEGLTPKRRAMMEQFLADPAAPRDPSEAASLMTSDCLGRGGTDTSNVSHLHFRPEMIRGELLRSLYLRPTRSSGAPRLDPNRFKASLTTPLADESAQIVRNFGDCVVAAGRADADSAIRATVGSDAETAAYRALSPVLAKCVMAGSTLRFSRMVLEQALSEALYKQAVVGVQPTATTGTH